MILNDFVHILIVLHLNFKLKRVNERVDFAGDGNQTAPRIQYMHIVCVLLLNFKLTRVHI